MTNISHREKSVLVDVPVRTAYDQWTQFEEFPRFMEGIEHVRQLDPVHLHWKAKIAGQPVEWDAEIVEQEPDERIAWRSQGGVYNAGSVTFVPEGPNRTRVALRLDFSPDGFLQKTGDVLGFVDRRIQGDLERFKEFIEERGAPTGAWRGRIAQGVVMSERGADLP